MNELRLSVQFTTDRPGFRPRRSYPVLTIANERFLLVNDDGRFSWVGADEVIAGTVDRGSERLFDLDTYLARRRLEGMTGKAIVFTTWEHIGFDPDEVTDGNMFLYRGIVVRYDGETLFLRRPDSTEQFGILPRNIATFDEDPNAAS